MSIYNYRQFFIFVRDRWHGDTGAAALWKIALPIILSNITMMVMRFVDTLILARWDTHALAAIEPSNQLFFLFILFFMGLSRFLGSLVSQLSGAGKYEDCGATVWQAFFLAIGLYLVLQVIVPFVPILIGLFNHDPSVQGMEHLYFEVVARGALFDLGNRILSMFYAGIGRTKRVMYSHFLAMILNIPLTYLFVFGVPLLNIPEMGIQGAALATVISKAVLFLVLAWGFFSQKYRKKYHSLKGFRFDKKLMYKLLRFGGPAGIGSLGAAAYIFFNLSIGAIGVIPQAAVNIVINWKNLIFVPLVGLGTAVSTLVGREMGAGRPEQAKHAAVTGILCAHLIAIPAALAFLLFPGILASFFNNADSPETSQAVLQTAVFLLQISSVLVLADSNVAVMTGILQGAGDTVFTMINNITMHWVVLAVPAWVLINVLHADIPLVWGNFILMVFLLALFYWIRFLSGSWQKIKVVD